MELPSSSKFKLPKGESYPLKRTALEQALVGLPAGSIYSIGYMRPQSDIVLHANFVGEAKRQFFAAGRFSIHIYAVPSGERKAVETTLIESGLEQLRRWLDEVNAQGSSWRATDHSFGLRWQDGKLRPWES